MLAVLLATAGCADDIPAVPPDTETGTSTTTSDTLPPVDSTTTTSGLDTTETVSATGTGTSSSTTSEPTSSSTTGETDSTTGEPAPGQTVSQLVSAGTRTASRNYTLVHTLGQPSPLQSTHASPSYRLQGGLIGANGSLP